MRLNKLDDIPPVLHEESLSRFKFFFGDSIQEGLSYRNELFCRLCSVDETRRAQLYHYGCQLARHEAVLITVRKSTYTLWMGLRSPQAASYIAEMTAESNSALSPFEILLKCTRSMTSERAAMSSSINASSNAVSG